MDLQTPGGTSGLRNNSAVSRPVSAQRAAGLDAVRAAAILLVLLSHCGAVFAGWYGVALPPLVAASGFYGVTLFFALSGFLIGRLLLAIVARSGGLFAWATFMARRTLRTLPLYFLVLAVLAVGWAPHFWEGRARLWADLPWFATLTQNLAWPMVDNWFDVSWSLTVEEWFYLGFSAALLVCARLAPRAAVPACIAAFLLVPLALRLALPVGTNWPEVTSKVAVLRFDAIAFGVAVAWLDRRRLPERALLAAGLALLALDYALVGGLWVWGWPLPARHWLENAAVFDLASLGSALCLPAAARQLRVGRLADPVLRALSAQSYCIYLIHLSLLEVIGFRRADWGLSNGAAILLTLALIWALSAASYRLIEAPLLALRPTQT